MSWFTIYTATVTLDRDYDRTILPLVMVYDNSHITG